MFDAALRLTVITPPRSLSLSSLSVALHSLSLSVPDEPERLVNLRLVVYIYIIICFFL